MTRPTRFLICSAVLLLFALNLFAQSVAAPPVTQKGDVVETLHGVKIADPYRWLENQESPETRAWITGQNAYTHALLDARPGRDKLQARFTQLRKTAAIRLPIERGGRYVYQKRSVDQEQYVLYGRAGADGPEDMLVDPNPMSADHSTNVEAYDITSDGKFMVFGMRKGGKDEVEAHVFDIVAHKHLPDVLPAAVYFEFSFMPDGRSFYYSLMTDDGPRVRLHKLGTDPLQDADVFGKGYNKDKIIVADTSEDGRYLVIQVFYGSAADKVEVWTQDLAANGPIAPLVNDLDARFYAYAGGDRLYLQTNWNAPRGRILSVDWKHPERANWREVVPEGPDAIDGNISVAAHHLFVTYVHDAASLLKVYDAGGKAEDLKFPSVGTIYAVSGHWEGKDAFIGFSSFTIARTLYRYVPATKKQTVWAEVNVPVDKTKFEARQVWFTSKDGTRVPMFVVQPRNLKLDGNHPVLLTGYGGFNINETPFFSPQAIVWAENGGVYADVNLRGGGEFGEKWHRAGMLENKQNVFDDFIAAAQWLIDHHYTRPEKLAISGGSNGGLLVGAALTQRPELYRAVICWHPLLDMLRYQKFMEAQFWVSEYGSSEDAAQFKYIYAYSPYQHVEAGKKYPSVLFMTGDGDTRVAPLHARKMAALMQSVAASDRPVMLRYELVAGHAGGRTVSQAIGDDVDEFSYLFWQLGVDQ